MEFIGWTVYDILATALAAAVGYAAVFLTGVIRAKVKNDVAAGLLQRLTESVADAVCAVNQQTHELLKAARARDSPGGSKLTREEAAMLRRAAVGYVKAYWGPKGLRLLAQVLADGERNRDKAEAQVNRVIEAKVEAAVGLEKRRAGTIITRLPAVHKQPM